MIAYKIFACDNIGGMYPLFLDNVEYSPGYMAKPYCFSAGYLSSINLFSGFSAFKTIEDAKCFFLKINELQAKDKAILSGLYSRSFFALFEIEGLLLKESEMFGCAGTYKTVRLVTFKIRDKIPISVWDLECNKVEYTEKTDPFQVLYKKKTAQELREKWDNSTIKNSFYH